MGNGSQPNLTRLCYSGQITNKTLCKAAHCGLVPENSMHMFRSATDPSFPWTGMTFGLLISSVWYWCSDQVGSILFCRLEVLVYWKHGLTLYPWSHCLKCLIRYDIIRWWADLSDSRWICLCLNTGMGVELLTHDIGLYDLNRKWSCFCRFSNLFENSLNVQCIHDIGHLLWTFNETTKYEKK